MNIWSRIKAWFAPLSPEQRIDMEDFARGTDWDEFDDAPCAMHVETTALRVNPNRLNYSDLETPALYRKETKQ